MMNHPFLFHIDFFKSLSKPQIIKILNYFEEKKIKKNTILYKQNERSKYLYIILTGEFEANTIYTDNLDPQKNSTLITRAYSGEILGESSVYPDMNHSSTVKALVNSEVLRISDKNLKKLIYTHPQLAINIGHLEAKKIRQVLSHPNYDLFSNKYIAHITDYDLKESHYFGINLSIAMTKASDQKIAYLHLSQCKETPFKTMNYQSNDNTLKLALEKMRNYEFYKAKDYLIHNASELKNISYLASMPNKLPINLIQKNDLSKMTNLFAKDFSHIFIELGSQKILNSKIIEILKNSDVILFGISGFEFNIDSFKKKYNYFQKRIPNFNQKVKVYINNIEILNKKQKKILTKKIWNQIEKESNLPVDFIVNGKINSLNEYFEPQLLVERNQSIQSAIQLRSFGRWLVKRRKGLALGGGGARALSEIGVLRALEEENIHFDYVTGTSMGSLIGALYAMGHDSLQIENLFAKYLPNEKAIFDYGFPFISVFKGKKVDKLLKKIFKYTKIEDLPIPFVCVACDLITGEEVHLTEGYLWKAVRASMSLPIIFPPVHYEKEGKHYYLIDGGILNNVPGDILRQERIHHVLGINSSVLEDDSTREYFREHDIFRLLEPENKFRKILHSFFKKLSVIVKKPPIFEMAMRSMMLEGAELIKAKSIYFDYFLSPDLKKFSLFDFDKRKELIEVGLKSAEKNMKEIKSALGYTNLKK